jgi:hypothetical protein
MFDIGKERERWYVCVCVCVCEEEKSWQLILSIARLGFNIVCFFNHQHMPRHEAINDSLVGT